MELPHYKTVTNHVASGGKQNSSVVDITKPGSQKTGETATLQKNFLIFVKSFLLGFDANNF